MTNWFWAGLITGLAANECCAISEWIARKVVRRSAFIRYGHTERAKIRAKELEAVIADRPGQLFKLITAACFLWSAVLTWLRRSMQDFSPADLGFGGTLVLRLSAMTAIVAAFGVVAFLSQQAMDRSLTRDNPPSRGSSSGSTPQNAKQVTGEESRLTYLQAQISNAEGMASSLYARYQYELDGIHLDGASGMPGNGPMANSDYGAYEQELKDIATLRVKLLNAEAALESSMSKSR